MDEEYSEDCEELEVVYLDEATSEIVDAIDNENFGDEIDEPDRPDLSKLTFNKHTKSVFCADLTKDGQLAVTGGEDDTAYLWLTKDGETKLECTGHKDSITSVCFNHDCSLLATGDMSGMIQVWDIGSFKLVWCYEGDDMEWLIWHSLTNVLISGTQSGEVYIWQIPQGKCKVLPSHGSACTSGKLLPEGKYVVTSYEDGQVKLWDIKQATTKWQFFNSQQPTATSLEINFDGALCSIAPSSNLIKLSDGKLIGTLLLQGETEIETHLFSNELNLLLTGSLSGNFCVWDLHTKMIRHQVKLDYGITTLKWGLNGKAFIGSTDGFVYICDVRSGNVVESLTGHQSSILSLCVSCCGSFILTTSDDNTAKIFSINYQQ